jgi:uncharacterized protein (TIGR02246 family)
MNRRWFRWSIVLVAILTLSACGYQGPAAIDRDMEAQTIRSLDAGLSEAAQTGDAVAFGAFFAENAVQMPPDAERLEGRAAIQESAAGLLGAGADLRFETQEVRVSACGDMATSMGKWYLSMETPAGPVRDEGSFVEVWQKVGGEWKITADIFNSDRPTGSGNGAIQ